MHKFYDEKSFSISGIIISKQINGCESIVHTIFDLYSAALLINIDLSVFTTPKFLTRM